MRTSFNLRFATGVILAGLALTPMAGSQSADGRSSGNPVEKGKYLVHHVAMCIECHSPRDARGNLDQGRILRGAPVPVTSPFPNRPWAFQAPAIAGLPGMSDAEAVHLLTKGSRLNGQVPRSPMPRFQLTRDDAQAVVAYLKSLR